MKNKTRLISLLTSVALLIGSAFIAVPRSAAQVTATPISTLQFLPTNTPRPSYTPTPAPTVTTIAARLCKDCNRLRLRTTPGTAGEIIGILNDTVELTIIGRSAENAWVEVIVNDGRHGWISTQYLRQTNGAVFDLNSLNGLPIKGIAIAASPTPTLEFLAFVPYWLTGISAHARQIYLKGQTLGNHRNVFSRVGDSITDSPYFLVPFAQGQYDLGQFGILAGTVSTFSGSFSARSMAEGRGWTADKLLTPGYANPGACGNDTPLVCEYKITKPSIALILIGTNDSGSGTTDAFAPQLRQIVEISINMGVIPVLSTLPPKNIDAEQERRVNAWNDVIHAVAIQYDIPLWDYYATMKPAPNRGMSADGLHPSVPPDGATCRFTPENLQYGFTIRNLNALQVLDALWKAVMY